MRSSTVLVAASTTLAVTATLTGANDIEPSPGVSLTVYSSADPAGFNPQQFIAQQRQGHTPNFGWSVPGFGVVRDVRSMSIDSGTGFLRLTDVAAFIDPTTVRFADLTHPATTILEQRFEFDLVSTEKLLERYIDRDVVITRHEATGPVEHRGTLLSTMGGAVLRTPDGIRVVPMGNATVQLDELPGGLITRPTLIWRVNAHDSGERLVRTTYQTAGITWRADYNLVLAADETTADLAAWVTLMNLSGATYPDAQLKLIAGDVQRIQPPSRPVMRGRGDMAIAMEMDGGAFEDRPFFEYHLYTLPRRVDVPDNSVQQITLFPTAAGASVEKVLVFDPTAPFMGWGGGAPYVERSVAMNPQEKLDVLVRFVNDEASGLGRPLPRGKVRVFKMDERDGTLEFVGEDLIDHTPRNEKVNVKVGQSFDVRATRTQADFTIDSGRKTMTETIRIELRNRKETPSKVIARERLFRWTNAEIVRTSLEPRKIDARTLEFDVTLAPDEVRTIEYTVRYTW